MSMRKFKKGAASFYIVAFSTLILMIVAISFATVIISEVERTSNDDLSQSAYDSALAGIEDAKLAYYNYRNCLAQEGVHAEVPNGDATVTCNEMLYYMDKANSVSEEEDCQIVWKILGKSGTVNGDVVEVTNGVNNNMQQATTCVTMTDEPSNYRGTLSASNMVDAIKLSFADGITADDIGSMRLKWFSRDDAEKAVGNKSDARLVYKSAFPALSVPVAAPPVVSLTVLQTGPEFTMDSFNQVDRAQWWTNRGTLYLRPQGAAAPVGNEPIGVDALVKSNDKRVQNEPYAVNCANYVRDIDGYACSIDVKLPKPVGGVRNDDTFQVVVSMPYGQPATEFSLEFYCSEGNVACGTETRTNESGAGSVAKTKGVQLEVDSTGRANDLYRRILTTLKTKNDLELSVMGPLELLDSGDSEESGLTKNLTVTKEYNFKP